MTMRNAMGKQAQTELDADGGLSVPDDIAITERRVWTGLQKLVVGGLSVMLASGTGLAGWSVNMQIAAREERQAIKDEAALERQAIKSEIRNLQESDRILASRAQKLEDWGPNAGDRVTADDLTETLVGVVNLLEASQEAARDQAAAMRELSTQVAQLRAQMAAENESARRERDRMMNDIDKLKERP